MLAAQLPIEYSVLSWSFHPRFTSPSQSDCTIAHITKEKMNEGDSASNTCLIRRFGPVILLEVTSSRIA
jgi:hypothetical protein